MSGGDGSLGEIRKALAGITHRLDALADAVGMAAAATPPGALLDEPHSRSPRQPLQSAGLSAAARPNRRPASSRSTAPSRMLARTARQSSGPTTAAGLIVAAQRGFRLPLEVRSDEGIVGRALGAEEVVQGGRGSAALTRSSSATAWRRPWPFRCPITRGGRWARSCGAPAAGPVRARHDRRAGRRGGPPRREPPASARWTARGGGARGLLREPRSIPNRGGRGQRGDGPARGRAAAILWPDGNRFVLAGGAGLPDGATEPSVSPMIAAVAETREPFVPAADAPSDPELARCLGATPRAVLPLSVDDWLIALLAVGGARPCGTALSPSFTRAAAVALRNARLHAESDRSAHEAPAEGAPPPTVGPDASAAPLGDMASLLAVVLGRLAAVRDRVGDPEAARDLVHAEEAAWRVAEGLRRVLGFAPRAGAHAAAPVDISAAIRDSVRATERLWATEGVVPSVTLDLEPVPPVRVHPDELRHAVHHLLQNAREAGDSAGPVTIWLRWNGATHVELSVADRGRGMDETTRARADEPFFTTKGAGRLGVGLAVVRAMASRHRGELEIESAPGQGTTVRLRLLTAAGPRGGAVRTAPAAPIQRRVLLVDDDQAVRETLGQGLEREGYLVHATGDVGEAVALLGREPVDLVVTDLVLPGGSGLEIARTAKRARPGVPVILVTGWPGRVDPHTLASHSIDAVVEKPVGLDTLRATAATLLGRASARPR